MTLLFHCSYGQNLSKFKIAFAVGEETTVVFFLINQLELMVVR